MFEMEVLRKDGPPQDWILIRFPLRGYSPSYSPFLTLNDTLIQNKIAYDLFVLSGLIDRFNIDKQTLSNFLSAVSSLYRSVPYHNQNHITHVLHSVWMVSTIGWLASQCQYVLALCMPALSGI
jgi:hypothetical protein